MKTYHLLILMTACLALNSCDREGCTDLFALNFNEDAEIDNNSCCLVVREESLTNRNMVDTLSPVNHAYYNEVSTTFKFHVNKSVLTGLDVETCHQLYGDEVYPDCETGLTIQNNTDSIIVISYKITYASIPDWKFENTEQIPMNAESQLQKVSDNCSLDSEFLIVEIQAIDYKLP